MPGQSCVRYYVLLDTVLNIWALLLCGRAGASDEQDIWFCMGTEQRLFCGLDLGLATTMVGKDVLSKYFMFAIWFPSALLPHWAGCTMDTRGDFRQTQLLMLLCTHHHPHVHICTYIGSRLPSILYGKWTIMLFRWYSAPLFPILNVSLCMHAPHTARVVLASCDGTVPEGLLPPKSNHSIVQGN